MPSYKGAIYPTTKNMLKKENISFNEYKHYRKKYPKLTHEELLNLIKCTKKT